LQVSDYPDEAEALARTCRRFGERGWCRATSGNFSVRLGADHCLITQSGRDKQQLGPDDLMVFGLDGTAGDGRPSAETPLHAELYSLDDSIGAVLHTHSMTSTVLSRRAGDVVRLSGFEMQKALNGFETHESEAIVTVFANEQDMHALAGRVGSAWRAGTINVPGFLVAGHGLYAWGRDLNEAIRHIEGFEFLFECAWQEVLAGRS